MDVPRIDVLGYPMADLSLAAAAEHLLSTIPAVEPYLVFTPNPEMVEAASRDPRLREALLDADLLLADGVGIVWASGILNRPLPEVVPGVDLLERLLGAEVGTRIFLLGTTEENVAAAARNMAQRYPGIEVVGRHHGYFPDREAHRILDLVGAADPDLVVLGMGVPRDQLFLAGYREHLPAALYLGVGGGLDVLSGSIRRAPVLLRKLHLEWLYRLIASPARWRRQLALPRFVWRVLRARLAAGSSLR